MSEMEIIEKIEKEFKELNEEKKVELIMMLQTEILKNIPNPYLFNPFLFLKSPI